MTEIVITNRSLVREKQENILVRYSDLNRDKTKKKSD